MGSDSKIMVPDYGPIIELCIKEMEIKFKNYGNDWLKQDDIYWKERILKEAKEHSESMTVDSEKRKLVNLINMCAMAHQTADDNRGCKKHIVLFNVIFASKDRTLREPCEKCGNMLTVKAGIIYDENDIID